MAVRDAPSRLHHLLRPRPPPLASFLSPYVCWHISMPNAFRFSVCAGKCNPVRRSHVMTARKGNSVAAFEGLCEVIWTVEADLADGQLLYITGEPVVLGCWKPEMAILMVPTEHSKLWRAEIKIAHGVNCKYNYFIKEVNLSSSHIFWRPGPVFSLSVPLISKQDKKIVVRDSWTTCNTERSQSHKWESWMEDTFFPIKPLIPAARGDKDDLMKIFVNGMSDSKHFRNDIEMDKQSDYEDTEKATHRDESLNILVNGLAEPKLVLNGHAMKEKFSDSKQTDNDMHETTNSPIVDCERDQPIEEPWFDPPSFLPVPKDKFDFLHKDESLNILVNGLAEPKLVLNGHAMKGKFSDSKQTDNDMHETPNSHIIDCERDQPIEEPWFDPPRFHPVPKDKFDFLYKHYQDTEKLLPEDDNDQIPEDDSVSTTILINSSLCTMQRIAVLEDDELVELLLEPVKSSVQSDSVYLGVFVKYLPKLGGAFLNIGITKHCLMSINKNREPFAFPPFGEMKKKKVANGSVTGTLKEHPAGEHNEGMLEDDGQDPLQMASGDYEELEVENDFHALKENADMIDCVNPETDLEDDLDGVEHFEDESVKDPVITEQSDHSLMPFLERLKESKLSSNEGKWDLIQSGTKIIVQVIKEGLGAKGPTVTPYPKLRSRFWILHTRDNRVGVSEKIFGAERTELKHLAKSLQPPGFGLTVRTLAAGRSEEELKKDLLDLLSTWKSIYKEAEVSALAADEGVEGAVPSILHRAMGQTLSVVQEYFDNKVKRMIVDSPRTFNEVSNYLREMAPDLCDRVELHNKGRPLFDQFKIEEKFNNILNKRVPLPNGGSLVIEQTEALVSIDVNGGHGMFGQCDSKQDAILEVNLAAAKQIAKEIRLRDIGGIIVVDFIDMEDEGNRRSIYEEVKRAVKRDRSQVNVSGLSKHGLMEITRKRVRSSVTFKISEPCQCCNAAGRVESLETSFAKIEQAICRYLAKMKNKVDPQKNGTRPTFTLSAGKEMCDYLMSGQKTRLTLLTSSLKVWIILKVARDLPRGAFQLRRFSEGNTEEQLPVKKATFSPIKKGKKAL